jgi:xanthine dehydrogenase YagS FAD-binding subunit
MAIHKFAYADATSLSDVLEALDEGTMPLAGGTDLLAMMKEELIQPERVINLKSLPDMDGMSEEKDGYHVGALKTLTALAQVSVLEEPSLQCLRQAILSAATPQIRHEATIAGNLLQRPRCWYFRNRLTHCLRKGGRRCFAFNGENKYHAIMGGAPCFIVHPSDPATALVALDGSVKVVGPEGSRTVSLEEFYLVPSEDPHREVDLAPNELVSEIIIPHPPEGARSVFIKYMERQAWDFALISIAGQIVAEDGVIKRARIALGGVAPVPWRSEEAEEALLEQPLEMATYEKAGEAALADVRVLDDNGYKLDMVRGAMKEALSTIAKEID